MQLATLISPDVIRVPLRSEDRFGVIRELVELLGEQGMVREAAYTAETAQLLTDVLQGKS